LSEDLDNVNTSGASWVWALSVDPSKSEDNDLYDSGASKAHFPIQRAIPNVPEDLSYPIKVASNHTLNAIGSVPIYINIPNGDKNTKLLLTDVLHVPGIRMTVVSMSCMLAAGYESHFQDEHCIITTAVSKLTLEAFQRGREDYSSRSNAYAFTMQSRTKTYHLPRYISQTRAYFRAHDMRNHANKCDHRTTTH